MRALMKTNLIAEYQICPELRGELPAVWQLCGWQEYVTLKLFLKSIEGKIVTLVFTLGDAFEKEDNNVWLPASLWDEI